MFMQSEKDIQVSSTSGVAIALKAGVARFVPEVLRVGAIQAGCMPVLESDGQAGGAAKTPELPTVLSAEARALVMTNAVKELIAQNDESKFKEDGNPRVDAMRVASGLEDITAEEVATAFIMVNTGE